MANCLNCRAGGRGLLIARCTYLLYDCTSNDNSLLQLQLRVRVRQQLPASLYLASHGPLEQAAVERPHVPAISAVSNVSVRTTFASMYTGLGTAGHCSNVHRVGHSKASQSGNPSPQGTAAPRVRHSHHKPEATVYTMAWCAGGVPGQCVVCGVWCTQHKVCRYKAYFMRPAEVTNETTSGKMSSWSLGTYDACLPCLHCQQLIAGRRMVATWLAAGTRRTHEPSP